MALRKPKWKKVKTSFIKNLINLDEYLLKEISSEFDSLFTWARRTEVELDKLVESPKFKNYHYREFFNKKIAEVKQLQVELEALRSDFILKGKKGFLKIIQDLNMSNEKTFHSKLVIDEKTELFIIYNFDQWLIRIKDKYAGLWKDFSNVDRDLGIQVNATMWGVLDSLQKMVKQLEFCKNKIETLMENAKQELEGIPEKKKAALKIIDRELAYFLREYAIAKDLSEYANKQNLKGMKTKLKRLRRQERREQFRASLHKLKEGVEYIIGIGIISSDDQVRINDLINEMRIFEADVLYQTAKVLAPKIEPLKEASQVKWDEVRDIIYKLLKDLQACTSLDYRMKEILK